MESMPRNEQRLSPTQLRNRLQLDYITCQKMFRFNSLLSGEAYATTDDLRFRRNQITSNEEGYRAKKYRVDFHVRTLVAPGKFEDTTTIAFDLEAGNYPYDVPANWLISSHVPYSPHFKYNAPVCIGELWENARGRMLFGHLLVHIAKLLNWDEVTRGNGYKGWNAEAIEYHRQWYHGRPITENLQYPPVVPPNSSGTDNTDKKDNTEGQSGQSPLIRPIQERKPPDDDTDDGLFRGKGRG